MIKKHDHDNQLHWQVLGVVEEVGLVVLDDHRQIFWVEPNIQTYFVYDVEA